MLAAKIRPGKAAIMANLSSDNGAAVCELMDAAGAAVGLLPSFGSDFGLVKDGRTNQRRFCTRSTSVPSLASFTPPISSSICTRQRSAPTNSLSAATVQTGRNCSAQQAVFAPVSRPPLKRQVVINLIGHPTRFFRRPATSRM